MSSEVCSDRRQLVSEDGGSTGCNHCCSRFNIPCTFDLLSIIVFAFLVTGLSLITIGYTVPQTYKFDPHKPARVMEAIEAEYAHRRFMLNLCIMFGTGLVTLSGLIISFIVTWELCSDGNTCNLGDNSVPLRKPPSYGSIYPGDEIEAIETGASSRRGAERLENPPTGS